jgi:hypothetical protein
MTRIDGHGSKASSSEDAHFVAKQLLLENLSSRQRDQFRKYGHFEVIGGTTGKRYRLTSDFRMNVEELDRNGRRTCLLCFLPGTWLPLGDVLLAQKLALELFEAEALEVANKIPTDFRMRA